MIPLLLKPKYRKVKIRLVLIFVYLDWRSRESIGFIEINDRKIFKQRRKFCPTAYRFIASFLVILINKLCASAAMDCTVSETSVRFELE